jgi:hypothetical protein
MYATGDLLDKNSVAFATELPAAPTNFVPTFLTVLAAPEALFPILMFIFGFGTDFTMSVSLSIIK